MRRSNWRKCHRRLEAAAACERVLVGVLAPQENEKLLLWAALYTFLVLGYVLRAPASTACHTAVCSENGQL